MSIKGSIISWLEKTAEQNRAYEMAYREGLEKNGGKLNLFPKSFLKDVIWPAIERIKVKIKPG